MSGERIALRELCENKILTVPAQYKGKIEYVDISSVDNDTKKIISTQNIDAKEAPSRAKQLIELNDILVSTVRPNLNAVALIDRKSNDLFVASTGYCVLRCRQNINNRYVFYFCQSPYFIDDMTRQATGASYPAVSSSIVKSSLIPFRTTDEQQKIVEQLDKVTDLITLRKQQLCKLDELVKARFVELFGDPRDNPNGYYKRQLKETCKVITGNTPSRAISEYYGADIEWIKTDNIVSGLMNPTTAAESLSEKGMAVSRTVEKDSILMACIAGSVSSIGRVCITDRKVAFNQQINAIVPNDYNVLFLYVLLQISKEYLVEEINMALKGILSKSKLEEKSFIVPPMELQEQFAEFVKQTDKSKLAIQKSLEELETLKKALMQEYFG